MKKTLVNNKKVVLLNALNKKQKTKSLSNEFLISVGNAEKDILSGRIFNKSLKDL